MQRLALAAAWRLVGSCVLVASVSACGFQLQGRAPLPESLRQVFIETRDAQTDLQYELRKSLVASGARLVTQRDAASIVVEILEDVVDERVLSVSGRNLPREYELTHRVRFSVRRGTAVVIDAEELRAVRDVTFDETQLLAREREQEVLREALARDVAALMLRRLSTL
jgi:LPS-assembly lipoprotein